MKEMNQYSKMGKKSKAVAECIKSLEKIGVHIKATEVKILVDDVYSDNKETMIRNILRATNIGISEKKIKEIC